VALSALAVAVFVFTTPGLSLAQGKPSAISIADAKKLPLGTEVTIEGTVTVATGTFRSSFNDEGFQIQDKTSGMYVIIKMDPHLSVGQVVRLTGKLSQTPLKFQIVETDENKVQVVSKATPPKPIAIGTGKITDATVGKLIKIAGTVSKAVEDIAPYGFRFSVDDGSGEAIAYVSTSTGISQKEMMPGQRVELIGVAGEFNHRYQIYPRSAADVKLIDKNKVTKGH
jgi:DNA/RNA endonuclease YhcR with UshA esterase domain